MTRRHAARGVVWNTALPELGPARDLLAGRTLISPTLIGNAGSGLVMRWTLANWQAPGFNKPQRSGLIRTCHDRSTGSKPLEDVTLDGVSHPILKRVLRGILKRPFDWISRVTIVHSRLSRLAYIEHEHRSHSFFHVTFTRPSYGDQRKAAQAAESVSKCPGIVPERAHTVTRFISAPTCGAQF